MKQKIYIETSVISYLTARISKDIIIAGHQISTLDFWNLLPKYEVFVSELVRQEAASGDENLSKARLAAISSFAILEINQECQELAKGLISDKAIPKTNPEDALHIAIAAYHGVDIIVTWNFKHINNSNTRKKIREVIKKLGYNCPEICSPNEFLG